MPIKSKLKLTKEDEQFVSEFKGYIDLLVDGISRELSGKAPNHDALGAAGRRFVEGSKARGMTDDAERVVKAVDDLVKHGTLAPPHYENGEINTEYRQLLSELNCFRYAFEEMGLTFEAGVSIFMASTSLH